MSAFQFLLFSVIVISQKGILFLNFDQRKEDKLKPESYCKTNVLLRQNEEGCGVK